MAPGQPGDPQRAGRAAPAGPAAPDPPPARRPAMRTGTGIFLVTVGAVLVFALKSGSPRWLNLQDVGVILILAGGLGLLLPWLARSRPDRDWLRRWVRPGQLEDLGVPIIAADQGVDLPAQVPGAEAPTLADELLSYEPHR